MNEETLFDEAGRVNPDLRTGRHRRNDWATSVDGARSVAYRAGSQKALLLEAFRAAWPDCLTDEEAAVSAGVSLGSEYSKRCGELRQDGQIKVVKHWDGTVVTRVGRSGVTRIVSAWEASE
jgi:hypothetical protein